MVIKHSTRRVLILTHLTARLIVSQPTQQCQQGSQVLQSNNTSLTSTSGRYLNLIHYQQGAHLSVCCGRDVYSYQWLHCISRKDCSVQRLWCAVERLCPSLNLCLLFKHDHLGMAVWVWALQTTLHPILIPAAQMLPDPGKKSTPLVGGAVSWRAGLVLPLSFHTSRAHRWLRSWERSMQCVHKDSRYLTAIGLMLHGTSCSDIISCSGGTRIFPAKCFYAPGSLDPNSFH